MILHIREEAECELEQAFDHYELERAGLGQEFLDEYVRGTHKIVEAPLRWPSILPGTMFIATASIDFPTQSSTSLEKSTVRSWRLPI